MNSITFFALVALLQSFTLFDVSSALMTSNVRRSWGLTVLRSSSGSETPTTSQYDLAYEYWMDLNDVVPPTAAAYLTRDACQAKFQNLVNAVKNVDGALAMVKNDPGVLRFKEETVSGSYAAWVRKFEGDGAKAMELCIRAPMILALKEKVVDATKPSDMAQTVFFSYFAVAFRGPTRALQQLIKPLIR
jgi:hypothetical protein